jgi:hypothetical protein
MEIPRSWSTSPRPLAIGNSGILSGFSDNISRSQGRSDDRPTLEGVQTFDPIAK